MEDYYIKNKLNLSILNPISGTNKVISGGGLDLDFFNKDVKEIKSNKTLLNDTPIRIDKKIVDFYPSDNLATVRKKIFLITGIPIYRQHIIYNKTNSLYKLFIGDEIINHDITKLDLTEETLMGVPIDKKLFNAKNDIQITMDDCIKFMYNRGDYINDLIIVDLFSFVNPHNSQLDDILKDNYQKDLLYYGFIIKYFPILSYDAFIELYVNNNDLELIYPNLAPEYNDLKKTFTKQKELMLKMIKELPIMEKTYDKITKRQNYKINIATVRFMLPYLNNRLFVESFTLDDTYIFISTILNIRNKSFTLIKKHTSYSNPVLIDLDKLSSNTIYIQTENNIKITIHSNYCDIELSFYESDDISFAYIKKYIKSYYNTLVDFISRFEKLVIVKGSLKDIGTPFIISSNIKFICNRVNKIF